MTGEWRPVVGWEGLYEVSAIGQVRRVGKSSLLVPTIRKYGHRWVEMKRPGARRTRAHVARLVLEAFVGPRPEGLEACHGDGDSSNNRVANLRWDTHSANCLDSVRHGTHPHASKTHCPQDHPYSPENTYLKHGRWRECRICLAAARARWNAKAGAL